MAVILHLGVPKTGTTSLQLACKRHAPSLWDHGVEYRPTSGFNHYHAAADRLLAHGRALAALDPATRARYEADRDQVRGHWSALLDSLPGKRTTLVSCESFAFFDTPLADEVLREITQRDPDLTVLVTLRQPATLLPSYFQQHVKGTALPDFESYARLTLQDLIAGRHDFNTGWLDIPSLRRRWQRPGVAWTEIPVTSSLWGDFLTALGVADQSGFGQLERANEAMSAQCVQIWQEHLAAHQQSPRGARHRARMDFLREFSEAADPDRGGRLHLEPAIAQHFDAAFGGQPTGTHERRAALAELQHVVHSGTRITAPVEPHSDAPRMLAWLDRRQAAWDRRYRAAAGTKRVVWNVLNRSRGGPRPASVIDLSTTGSALANQPAG